MAQSQSDLERTLHFQLTVSGLQGWVQQYRWHPERQWAVDFAWPDQKLLVEVQGGVHIRGRHTRGPGYTEDCRKLAEAQRLGWRVLWLTADVVRSGEGLQWVETALQQLRKESA